MTDIGTNERPPQRDDVQSAKPDERPIVISGKKARQGEIVLDTRSKRRRVVGILVLCILVLVIAGILF